MPLDIMQQIIDSSSPYLPCPDEAASSGSATTQPPCVLVDLQRTATAGDWPNRDKHAVQNNELHANRPLGRAGSQTPTEVSSILIRLARSWMGVARDNRDRCCSCHETRQMAWYTAPQPLSAVHTAASHRYVGNNSRAYESTTSSSTVVFRSARLFVWMIQQNLRTG